MIITYQKYKKFTLVELIVAMSIFAVLMLLLMQIFGSVQTVWRKTSAKADTYESVRLALNIIESDFMNAFYFDDNPNDMKGTHFYYTNKTMGNNDYFWLPVKRLYSKNGAKTSLAEVSYTLNKPSGSDFYNLHYFIKEDSADFLTNSSAQTRSAGNILLENICSFSIYPLNMDYGSIDAGRNVFLPQAVMITIAVIDDDEKVKTQYNNGATELKRTFSRVIVLDR